MPDTAPLADTDLVSIVLTVATAKALRHTLNNGFIVDPATTALVARALTRALTGPPADAVPLDADPGRRPGQIF